jgi:hypothetical protein
MRRVSVGAVERVAGALAFDGDDETVGAVEVAEDGVGVCAVDFDMALDGKRVAVAAARRAGVAQQHLEEVVEEAGQNLRLAEVVDPLGADQLRPVLELGAEMLDGGRVKAST